MATKPKRNDRLIDKWSFVHFASSAVLCWFVGPVPAFVITALWEPFEIFVVSPILGKRGIVFGYETWRNSLSDIVFNTLGISMILLLR
ncbi:hypothetical protein KDA14_02835 [Candidatus Saccharibacteria bacterium]|nr:hypothetical protein [Candidatus Saccharibacteria bacterium]